MRFELILWAINSSALLPRPYICICALPIETIYAYGIAPTNIYFLNKSTLSSLPDLYAFSVTSEVIIVIPSLRTLPLASAK